MKPLFIPLKTEFYEAFEDWRKVYSNAPRAVAADIEIEVLR